MYKSTEDTAKAVATALISEFKFPVDPRPVDINKWTETLWNAVPTRKQLGDFQSRINSNEALKAVPKASLAPEISNAQDIEDDTKALFCVAHADFLTINNIDIDHSEAHAEFKKKQEAFVEFLNEHVNIDFANVFLAEAGVENLFMRDKKDGRIKGTTYFYKICYNAIDNLWLICHGCNITKLDQDPLQWFGEQEQYYGKPFLESIKVHGGLQSGVILSAVGGTHVATLKIRGSDCKIYSGGIGLGKYARDWFVEKYPQEFSFRRECFNKHDAAYNEQLAKIRKLREEGKEREALKNLKILKRHLLVSCARQEGFAQAVSDTDSSSDSPNAKKAKLESAMANEKTTDAISRHLSVLRKLLIEVYPTLNIDIDNYFDSIFSMNFQYVALDSIINLNEDVFSKLQQEMLPDWTVLKEEIREAVKSFPEQLAESKKETEREATLRQAAEQRATEEANLRKEREQEIAILKKQLAEANAQSPQKFSQLIATQASVYEGEKLLFSGGNTFKRERPQEIEDNLKNPNKEEEELVDDTKKIKKE